MTRTRSRNAALAAATVASFVLAGTAWFLLWNTPTSQDGFPTFRADANPAADSPPILEAVSPPGEHTYVTNPRDRSHASASGWLYCRPRDSQTTEACDGYLTVSIVNMTDRVEETRRLRVRKGRWSSNMRSNERLVPREFVCSLGRRADCTLACLPSPFAWEFPFTAIWRKGIQLSVLDRKSRQHLSEVQLTFLGAGEPVSTPPVGPSPRTAEQARWLRGTSPFSLPCFDKPMQVWIQSQGHETRLMGLVGCEGTRTMVLNDSPEIAVDLCDGKELGSHLVFWTSADSVPYRSIPLRREARMRVSGMPASELHIALALSLQPSVLEIVDWQTLPAATGLAERSVSLCGSNAQRARATGTIALQWSPPEAPIQRLFLTPLARQPLHAGIGEVSLAGVSSGTSLMIQNVLPGDYCMAFDTAAAPQLFSVTAGGATTLQLTPELDCPLTIDVFVPGRESPLTDAQTLLRRKPAAAPQSWIAAGFDQTRGAYFHELPAGEYQVAVSAKGYDTKLLDVSVAAPSTHLTVFLEPAQRFELEIQALEGDVPVPLPLSWWAQ